MFTLSHLLGLFGANLYRWEEFVFASAASNGHRGNHLVGRRKSIYHKWGFNNTPYYVQLSKAERKGKSWQETQAMRRKIWKEQKNG